ncbi:hypothetical protein H4217_005156 [Coemansia sp. RSA 1939]|nr:hypothetical protein H4217_005156 [Coemansia sp. RSA 1939]KAJ2611896.1 hypothetical protein EV177_003264 [Coemansia sp. RSA 1804]
MFFALRGIKEAVVSGYSISGVDATLTLRDELFHLAVENSRIYAPFVLESLCWTVAVITKRLWADLSEEKRATFIQVLCNDILDHATPCIGIATTKYILDEVSGGSRCSDLHVPWEFHYACKVSFERLYMPRLFEASLKILHRQLQRSYDSSQLKPGGRQTIAYERRSALHIVEKVLGWTFTSSDPEKVIDASFGQTKGGSRGNTSGVDGQCDDASDIDDLDGFENQNGSLVFNDETQNRTPFFPHSWQPLLLNRDILGMFFSVYDAAVKDQMHTFFSPGSAHLALQCLIQVSGIRGKDIFSAPTSKESDALRIEYAQIIMRGQLGLIRRICAADLTSEGSEGVVMATTQMVRRFIEAQLAERPLSATNGQRLHPLTLLTASVPETFEYFNEVGKLISMLLRAASGILESDMIQHIDEDFGDMDNYFVMQAFDELASAWSSVINEIREWSFMEDANGAYRERIEQSSISNANEAPDMLLKNSADNPSVLASFMQFLATAAHLIRSDYIQLRMLMCEDSVYGNDAHGDVSVIDQGLLAKDYVVYEDQLQFFALLSRLDIRTSMDRLHESLCSRCNALQSEFGRIESKIKSGELAVSGGNSSQKTIDLLHEQIQWIILLIGHSLADSGISERVLIPQPIIDYSASCLSPEQDMVVHNVMVILKLLQFELESSSSELAAYVSPLLIETIYWLLRRIGPIYLLFNSSDYRRMSSSLISAFGASSEGGNGQAIVQGLLNFVRCTFDQWSSEEDLLHMCISLLRELSQCSSISQEITQSPLFTPFVLYLFDNISRIPESTHSSVVEALELLTCYAHSAEHDHYFSKIKALIMHGIINTLSDKDFEDQCHDSRIVSSILDGLDMMDGLLSAANFRNMDMVFQVVFEMHPILARLLSVYSSGDEVPRKVVQVLESAMRYLDISSLADDDYLLQFSHNIKDILHRYHALKQRRGVSLNSSTDIDSLGETTMLISTMSYFIRNEMGFAANEASQSANRAVSDSYGETEVFGLYCIHTTVSLEQLQAPNVLRGYMQFLSEMIQYRTPSLLRWLPLSVWHSVVAMLVKGTDNEIFDVCRRTYEAVSKLGAYLKVVGLGDAPEGLQQVLSNGIKQMLSKLLETLLFSPFDAELVEPAGVALVTLGLLDPEHLQACFRELFSSVHSGAAFAERLSATLSKFNSELESSEPIKSLLASTDLIPDPIDGAALRQPLFEFLVNARAVLRIK